MDKIPSMVDMAKTPKEVALDSMLDQSAYPYGLCISLCEDELEKLGFGQDELNVGDMLHLHCLASVTAVSNHDNVNSGPSCRVELQIKFISAEESEDEENQEAEKNMSAEKKISKLYK